MNIKISRCEIQQKSLSYVGALVLDDCSIMAEGAKFNLFLTPQ